MTSDGALIAFGSLYLVLLIAFVVVAHLTLLRLHKKDPNAAQLVARRSLRVAKWMLTPMKGRK